MTTSGRLLLVLSPAWIQEQWPPIERLLTKHDDSPAILQRMLPALRQPCDLPPAIAALTYADLSGRGDSEIEFSRLLDALRAERRLQVNPVDRAGDTEPMGSSAPASQNLISLSELLVSVEVRSALTAFRIDLQVAIEQINVLADYCVGTNAQRQRFEARTSNRRTGHRQDETVVVSISRDAVRTSTSTHEGYRGR